MSALRTFRGEEVPHFKIIEHRRWWYVMSAIALSVSIGALVFGNLQLSIDFEGGAALTYPSGDATVEEVQTALRAAGRNDAEVQIIDGTTVVIRTASLSDLGAGRTELLQSLAELSGVEPDAINVEDIGPSWGQQIFRRMIIALLLFLVAVTIYITMRFEWKMALGALFALFHDVVITAGIYVLVGRQVTPETVIAILTILGFSLYDTVVIYDKIQENTASPAIMGKRSYADVVNESLNQTVMRSVNTSLVVLLPIASLLLFGGETLKDFAFALFLGVGIGVYSSIFIASPFLVTLKEREPRYRAERDRAQARSARREPVAEVAGEPGDAPTPPRPAARKAGGQVVVPPRPRKKKSAAKRKKK